MGGRASACPAGSEESSQVWPGRLVDQVAQVIASRHGGRLASEESVGFRAMHPVSSDALKFTGSRGVLTFHSRDGGWLDEPVVLPAHLCLRSQIGC